MGSGIVGLPRTTVLYMRIIPMRRLVGLISLF
jgi:hypothetical protein